MAEPVEHVELPQAMVGVPKRRRLSVVWIIPILAAVIAIGIAVQRARSEGPTITIVFKAAEGIEAGKTFIRYKDVNIGQVKTVHLTDDFSKVEVTAKITKRAAGLMVEDAKFWIVRPTVSLSGISGLSTLLSGNYIGFQAGESKQEQTDFLGLENAPFIAGKQGSEFVLKADDLGSLSAGSPIYYRRLPVGQVVSYGLAQDGKSVEVRVFVSSPYDRFVSPGTRFWKASGIDISVDANGFDIRTESLVALLVGGLAFDMPPFVTDTEPAKADAVFTLYSDRATAMKAPDAIARHYVLHFNESLRGLSVGAPVAFLGLTAGEVTEVGLELDPKSTNIRPRVMITFYPERVIAFADPVQRELFEKAIRGDDKKRYAFMQRLIDERGMRAQLRSGSLLTGQLYVAFDYFPKAGKSKVDWKREVPELPVMPSTLVDLEAKLTGILDKIDKMPLDQIATSLKKDLDGLDTTLASANRLLTRVDETLVPSIKTSLDALQRATGSFEKTLDGVNRTLENADATLLGPNAPAQQELRDALTEFTRAARSVRVLIDYLERHPESPIRGKVDMSGGK
jgi:paraquat-inducible protein B